jgi:hypothetical protein
MPQFKTGNFAYFQTAFAIEQAIINPFLRSFSILLQAYFEQWKQ